MKIAILIPAYEPDDKLCILVKELADYGYPIIVVDDGSGDDYRSIFEEVSKYSTVLTHTTNCGKGKALKTGIKYVNEKQYGGVVTADSDGQHSVEDIVKICQELDINSSKLILGVRDLSIMPFKSKFGNTLTRILFKGLYGISVSDTQTGLRGIPLTMERGNKLLKLKGDRYEYEMNMLIYQKEIFEDIEEVSINTIYYKNNEASHFRPFRDGFKIYSVVFSNMPKFILASLSSFVIDYILFVIFNYILKNGVVISTICSRIISATYNYNVNKRFVFRGSDKNYNLLKYFLLAIFILLANSMIMYLLADCMKFNALISKIFVELILYLVSFMVQNRWAKCKIS